LSGIFFSGSPRRVLIGLLPVLLAAGCASPKPVSAPVNLSGFPPAFRDGYADGCASAKGRLHQDPKRFEADRQYAAGWRDGMDVCRRSNK
jgi:hypothetical protein